MSNNIILESRFTTHQKTHLILSIGAPFILVIFLLIRLDLTYLGSLVLLLFIISYSAIICLAFTKTGLLKKRDKLYRGLYFAKKLILKKKIDLTNKSKVSILKFKRNQKMAWFSAAKPDLALEYNAFDVTLLNGKHTQKKMLVSLSNKDISKKTVEYLETNFSMKFEIYSPDFS